jgi:hypothetical protein
MEMDYSHTLRHPLHLDHRCCLHTKKCGDAGLWHYQQRETYASLPKRYLNWEMTDQGKCEMKLAIVDGVDIGDGQISLH